MSETESGTEPKSEPEHEHELAPSYCAVDADTDENAIWFFVRYICVAGKECDFSTFVAIQGEEV